MKSSKIAKVLAVASGATTLASWYAHAVAADPDKTPYDLSFWREGASIATWGVWQLLPALEKLMEKAGDTKLDGILVGMGSVFLFLELLYQAVPPKKKDAGNEEPDTTSDADKAE